MYILTRYLTKTGKFVISTGCLNSIHKIMKPGINSLTNLGLTNSVYLDEMQDTALEGIADIPALAALICETGAAALFLADGRQLWHGIEPETVGFDMGDLLSLTVQHANDDVYFVNDLNHTGATQHKLPLISGKESAFVAYLPLISDFGLPIGYLSVIGNQDKTVSAAQQSGLKMLGKQIVNNLKLNAQISVLEKSAEELRTVKQLKQFYERILHNLPTDIAVFDADHKYLFVNPGAIGPEEYRNFIIGKDDFDYCEYRNRDKSLAELRRARFLEVKKSKKEIRWEDTVKDTKGNPFTSLRRLFPVYDENGELSIVIGFGLDITDRKLLEVKQAALVDQLSVQNTQLIDFCNIVSHNLRAPLVNMSMLVEYIQETEDEEEKNDLISKLNPVIDNLHNTFNELVESIQIKQDVEVKSEKIALVDCLKRVQDELGMEIEKCGAMILFDFHEAPVIDYPYKYMLSILQNLISNALKYQSPYRKPLINVRTKNNYGSVVLTVSDNGLGIDLEQHKDNLFKIGKVFHRHPNAKGFGLFMTKTQVEAMNGRMWVESNVDVGTTFFIEIKMKDL